MNAQSICLASFCLGGALLIVFAQGCVTDIAEDTALRGTGPIGGGGPAAGLGGASGASGSSGSEGGTAGSGGNTGNCVPGGTAQVRLANLLPAVGKVDFCIKEASAADYSEATRAVSSLGDASHNGLAFKEVSRKIQVPSGSYEVKAVDASLGCDAAGLVPPVALCLSDTDMVTTALLAGSLGVFQDAPAVPNQLRLRFIHAIEGQGPLDVGLSDGASPAHILLTVFSGVAFTSSAAEGITQQGFVINKQGYLELTTALGSQVVAVAPEGKGNDALFEVTLDLNTFGVASTAFAVGSKTNANFPPAAIVCDEGATSGVLTSCVSLP